MSGLCLVTGGLATLVATGDFTLSWTHSVERTEWRERWSVAADGLRLSEARVRGSGAGMDPGDGALLVDGWWVWMPALPAVSELVLAASGDTGGGWTLCADAADDDACTTLGAASGDPLVLRACASP